VAVLTVRRGLGAIVLLAGVSAAATAAADDPGALADEVKATYLYKFAPFVGWPPPPAAQTSFPLCVYGADGVTAVLPQAISGQRIGGRPISLRVLPPAGDPAACEILYLAGDPPPDTVIDALRHKPILTVSSDEHTRAIIHLVVVAHHVRFSIDADAAEQAGLSISSKLLELAVAVNRDRN
jgi:hypothetical protein